MDINVMRGYLPLFAALFSVLQIGCQTCCCNPAWYGCGVSPAGWFQQTGCGQRCGYGCQSSCNSGCVYGGGLFSGRWHSDPCEPDAYPGKYEQWKDNYVVNVSSKRCAQAAIKQIQSMSGCDYSRDFRCGFEQAYHDIAKGGRGVTPAVPPEKYWKASYRTERGHRRADDWFAGYRVGSEMARAQGLPEYNFVKSSFGTEQYQSPAHGCSRCQMSTPQ